MRIAIFSNTYWPTVNGVAISIANLRRGLLDLGHEVRVYAPAPPGFDASQDQPGVVRFPGIPAPVEADYQVAMPSGAVVRSLHQMDCDVVHTEHPIWVGSWGLWYARLTGRPLVTTIHTQYEIYSSLIPLPDALVEAYMRRQVKAYCNKCHWITTPAASARDRLLAQGVTTPIEVVFNPTDLAACFSADGSAIRREMGCGGPEDRLLGYVGRLSPEKNLVALLQAAGIILERLPRAQLLLIGDGPSRAPLEAQAAQLPCADRIRFLGKVPHPRVPEYQAALDLFITASTMEVQPLSFAEAFAAGTPIVAYDVPGNNDMIRDGLTGRLVPVEAGAEGLAQAAVETLSDREVMAALGAGAREWSHRYDLPQVVKRMVEVYEKAVGCARRGRKDRAAAGGCDMPPAPEA